MHSSYEAKSLLPFLSEKHICILFLIKHFVLIECIDIIWLHKRQLYDYMITYGFYIARLHPNTRDVTENNGTYTIFIF